MKNPDGWWWQGIRYEPARIYGWLVAAMQVASAFGLDITAEQRNALLGLALASLAVVEMLRRKVSPTAKLDDRRRRGGAPAMAANPGEQG